MDYICFNFEWQHLCGGLIHFNLYAYLIDAAVAFYFNVTRCHLKRTISRPLPCPNVVAVALKSSLITQMKIFCNCLGYYLELAHHQGSMFSVCCEKTRTFSFNRGKMWILSFKRRKQWIFPCLHVRGSQTTVESNSLEVNLWGGQRPHVWGEGGEGEGTGYAAGGHRPKISTPQHSAKLHLSQTSSGHKLPPWLSLPR